MNYIEDFLNRNESKPFVVNLKKYIELNKYGRMKCLSSFYTHLLIDAENNIDNSLVREEVLSLITNAELYNEDKFLLWLEEKLR